ncbi:unnamed protein product [Mytilus coruscus]|uniref:Uncharacterized protein n=1 Tax=Mytilus coruscus TaxID=42192 RepID=A0A6J8CTH7_MYTCO|nr:unnamed protein product [Mytilus coruscus]
MEHAVPIAFALKGYSVSTNIMRKMLKDVFIRCFEKELYVPVISFDGQWYNLCVRSNTGEPMTLLQLQKTFLRNQRQKQNFHLTDGFSLNKFQVLIRLRVLKAKCMYSIQGMQMANLKQEERVTLSSSDVITDDSFAPVNRTEDHSSLHEISQTLDNENQSNSSKDVFCLNENDYQTIALSAVFNKKTILACLKSIACKLKDKKIHFLISWPKYKITEFLNHIAVGIEVKRQATSRRKNVVSLQKLCKKVIRTFSKDILNIVDAEYAFPLEKQKWILDMPFDDNLEICGLTKQINWFSKPEYSQETSSSKFFLLDCHHILTNVRIKCCKTGIPEAGIHRQAWVKLTKSEHDNVLSKALDEDLVDCQSNSFAHQTFSQKVEDAMRLNGDNNEAMFCRLIRE